MSKDLEPEDNFDAVDTGHKLGPIVKGYVLPGLPHILLKPERNEGWQSLKQNFNKVREEIEKTDADLLIIYSTYWPSILGHQIQAQEKPKWVHVDDQFHELGSIPYEFKTDTDFAKAYCEECTSRGLHARAIDYEGFPIDTGSVVVQKLINPDNRLPVVIVSSNIYSDRAETIVLGKAASDALIKTGKKAVSVVVSSLSNRLFTEKFDPKDDKINSLKDQEWNQKFLEFLGEGRLEDVSQLSRQFHREARVQKVTNFKPFWWLAAVMGQNNFYSGEVIDYQAVCGTGAAIVGLTPTDVAARDLEFDEDDPEAYQGERNVLGTTSTEKSPLQNFKSETKH